MKICILTIATNKYIQFVERLYDNIEDNFVLGQRLTVFFSPTTKLKRLETE